MVLVFKALRLRTLGRFKAANPWNRNQSTEFSIEEYVMMPSGATLAVDSSQYAHRVGLRSELDGDQHILPESLVELWRRGQVPAENMPALAQAIAPRIVKEDCNLILHQDLTKTVLIPMIFAFAALAAIGYFVPVNGHTMSLTASIALGFGFSLFVVVIQWAMRQSGRARRAEQMQWLLSVQQSGGASSAAPPPGRTIGRVKMFLIIFALLIGLFALILGGAYVKYRMGAKASDAPASAVEVSSTTGDIQMPFEVMASQIKDGLSMLVTVPVTGEQLTVKIPPQAQEGTRLRLRGKGAPSGGNGAPGDLYLKIHIRY